MIIEHEGIDHTIYSEATAQDFERAVADCYVLSSFGTTLERVETKENLELYWVFHDELGEHKCQVVSYSKVEQELTIYL